MFVDKKETVTRVTKRSIELTAIDIRSLIRATGTEISDAAELRVYFAVPGGGNWSNTDIDIDNLNPVYVEWTETEEINV